MKTKPMQPKRSKVRRTPIDKSVSRTIYASISVMAVSVGAALLLLGYFLLAYPIAPTLFGIGIIWVGSLFFLYAVLTEEHTLKELFLREEYFAIGMLSMVAGLFFVTMGGFFSRYPLGLQAVQFGVLLLLSGAAIMVMSAQRYRDYTKNNALFAGVAGLLLIIGGIVAGDSIIPLLGVGMLLLSGFWLGLRSKKAF